MTRSEHRTRDDRCTQVPKLLALRFGSPRMITSRLLTPTRLMRWPEVLDLVRPTELERSNVLDDPAISHTVDAAIANHASPARALPRLKPTAIRQRTASRCANVLKRDVRHQSAHFRESDD
jgi:hypothetical protein